MPFKDPKREAEYQAKYRAARRDEKAAATAAWRAANPGRAASAAAAWRKKNPDRAAANNRRWRAENRERVRATAREWRKRTGYSKSPKRIEQSRRDWLRTHGLTVEQFDEMVRAQSGRCAICNANTPRMKNARRLYVDHDHATDRVRGLLCHRCNIMLGAADDSPERLIAAAAYLRRASNGGGPVRSGGRRLLGSRRR